MNKNTGRVKWLYIMLTIAIGSMLPTIPIYADDDMEEEEDTERIDASRSDNEGIGREESGDNEIEMKREGEGGEGEDDDEGLGAGIANTILYITIAAVIGTIGYTMWKVLRIRSKVKA